MVELWLKIMDVWHCLVHLRVVWPSTQKFAYPQVRLKRCYEWCVVFCWQWCCWPSNGESASWRSLLIWWSYLVRFLV